MPVFAEGTSSTNRFKHEGCEEQWYHDMLDGSVRGIISACCGNCKRSYADHRLIEPVWEKAGAPVPQISQPQGSGKYPGYAELSVLQVLDKLQDHDLLEIFYDDEQVSVSEQSVNPNYGQPNNVNQHTQTISVYRSLIVRKAKFLVGKRVEGVLTALRGELKLAKNTIEHREQTIKDYDKTRAELAAEISARKGDLKRLTEEITRVHTLLAEAVAEAARLAAIIEASKNLRVKVPNFEKGMPIVVGQKEGALHENQNPGV